MQEGMSRMGLAICLTQLLTHDQLEARQSDLTSFYIDYMPHNLLTRCLSTQPTTASTN